MQSTGQSTAIQEGIRESCLNKLPTKLQKFAVKANDKNSIKKLTSDSTCCSCGLAYLFQTAVKEGDICLAWNDNQPLILGPGLHCLTGYPHTIVKESKKYIEHGPTKIITIHEGEIGYGEENGTPMLLLPGRHIIQSRQFVWNRWLNLAQEVVNIGPLKIIRVDFGRVGVASKAGQRVCLEPGIHLVEPPDVFFHYISTRLQILELPSTVQESADYVPLKVKANVSYRVVEPVKLIDSVEDHKQMIKEVASSTISSIIRSSTLGDIAAHSKKDFLGEKVKGQKHSASVEGTPFHEQLFSRFMSQVGDKLLKELGIEVVNINVVEIRIENKQLADMISKQAIKISDLEAQHTTLAKEREVKREKALIEKEQATLLCEADIIRATKAAEALKIKKDSELKVQIDEIKLKAAAKAEAMNMQSDAEARHAERMSQTPLHEKLAIINATMGPQVTALKNVKQIAYVPHLPSLLNKNGCFMDYNNVVPDKDGNIMNMAPNQPGQSSG